MNSIILYQHSHCLNRNFQFDIHTMQCNGMQCARTDDPAATAPDAVRRSAPEAEAGAEGTMKAVETETPAAASRRAAAPAVAQHTLRCLIRDGCCGGDMVAGGVVGMGVKGG